MPKGYYKRNKRVNNLIKICQICKKSFEVLPHMNKRIFCSKSCSATARNNKIYDHRGCGCWNCRAKKYYYSCVEKICQICGREQLPTDKKRLHVDHCHETDEIRGLLCSGCNLHLGRFEIYKKEILFYLKNCGTGIFLDPKRHIQNQITEFRKSQEISNCSSCNRGDIRICIDHCHKTLEIRGTLCITCNVTLGWYEKHDIEINNYLKIGIL